MSTSNARSFNIALDRFLARGREKAQLAAKRIALEAATRVVMATPVDTGFCRMSWQIAIGAMPATATIQKPADFAGAASGAGEVAIARIAEGAQAFDPSQPGAAYAWIYNPVVYAIRLEHGHSAQAPAGMVGLAADAMRAKYGRA